MMTTADLSLRFDPTYEPIARRFRDDQDAFADAFARAWFKSHPQGSRPTIAVSGPRGSRSGVELAGPDPPVDHPLIEGPEIDDLKQQLRASGLSVSELVSTAWASASSFRGSDKRGGANGARLRLAPQRSWEVNRPAQLDKVLGVLEGLQQSFNASRSDGKRVSLADLIVLAGGVGVEQAAAAAGHTLVVPFHPGRMDASEG